MILSICLVSILAVLYGQFLLSPLIFDDQNIFRLLDENGTQIFENSTFSLLGVRSLPYTSFTWTKEWFGSNLLYYRLGNLFLHAAVALALYGFLRCILTHIYVLKTKNSLTANQAAALAAFIFALHPLTTYAVGYLVQRTILMATLFSILAMWSYAKGSIENKTAWLWCSVPFYYLAVFCKEHTIMLPAVLVALTAVLHSNWFEVLIKRKFILLALTCIAIEVILIKSSILGTVYELEAKNMLGQDFTPLAYPLSIITQCGLFFKYLFLWLLPYMPWTSIDMREPFARSFWSWHLLGVLTYIIWGCFAIYLLTKRKHYGLIGFAMFYPWVFFFTELATVRIQEPFVLYRSYLWFCGSLVGLPIIFASMQRKVLLTVGTLVCLLFSLQSMERLATFSHPILVWEDAAKLVMDKKNIQGQERIYYNLARHQYLNELLEPAEVNINIALSIDPDFAQAHAIYGAILIKKNQWADAIAEYTISRDLNARRGEPPDSTYLLGRARAYEASGALQKAADDYLEACRINFKVCEFLRKSATVIP